MMTEGRDNVVVDVEALVANLRNPTQSKPKIFQVDDRLRQVKAKDYEPKILAIGPIHRKKAHLKMMEQHKVRYLHQLLHRRPDLSIHKFVEKLREMKEVALKCYSTSLNLDTDEFVKMLLLDSCFVIELLRNYFSDESSLTDKDPIFESETLSQISHDLMLFENQLPFVILNTMFEMTKNAGPDDSICHLVLFLVRDMFPWSDVQKHDPDPEEMLRTDHLLGLVYRCYFPFSTKTPSKGKFEKGKNSGIHINSASELKHVGIRLKRCKENNLCFEGGVLKLPSLQVSGKTESLLRNLMAYEQLCLDDDHPKHVTDYAFFVHCLIRSTKDVEILRRSGIISNFLGGDVKIYQMFDRLVTNFLRLSEFCYSDVFERLNGHCGRRREKWMARLWRDYFNSPWSMMKFLAAVLLLGISIAQVALATATFKHLKDVVKVHSV